MASSRRLITSNSLPVLQLLTVYLVQEKWLAVRFSKHLCSLKWIQPSWTWKCCVQFLSLSLSFFKEVLAGEGRKRSSTSLDFKSNQNPWLPQTAVKVSAVPRCGSGGFLGLHTIVQVNMTSCISCTPLIRAKEHCWGIVHKFKIFVESLRNQKLK